MKTVLLTGYAGRKVADLKALAEQHNAMVVDIRYAPFSRQPEWQRDRLRAALDGNYIHIQHFGNRNYRGDGPIVLVDPAAGMAILNSLPVQTFILICVCRKADQCHRTTLARFLRDSFSCREVGEDEWKAVSAPPPPEAPPPAVQGSLF